MNTMTGSWYPQERERDILNSVLLVEPTYDKLSQLEENGEYITIDGKGKLASLAMVENLH